MVKNNNKGFSAILIILLVIVLGFVGYLIYTAYMSQEMPVEAPPVLAPVVKNTTMTEDEFMDLEEPVGTPEEINNQTLDELDQLINDVDLESEADLSDL